MAFSSTSMFSKASSPDQFEQRQAAGIAAAEDALAATCQERGTGLCLLRPTLIYGCGMDRNISLLAGWIKRFGFVPVSRQAKGLRQPVHVQDLASAAVAALQSPQADGLVSAIVGGSTLTYRTMVGRIFTALGRHEKILPVPAGLLAAAAGMAGMLGGKDALRPEMVRRQARDLVFDDLAARTTLSIQPRGFHPAKQDFSLPPAAELQRLAMGRPAPG